MTAMYSPGEGENYKIIYKELSDLGRQIDAVTSRCYNVQDLFGSEILGMRYKFRESCETLLCGSPQFYGRVVREKLWRHAYYDVICRARRLLKDKEWDSLSIAYVTQHLFHGIGHLNVVLMKLEDLPEFKQARFPFNPNGIDNILENDGRIQVEGSALAHEVPKWLNDLIYIILINVGDLYRYLTDVYSKRDQFQAETYFNQAKDYYSQAFVIFPDSGFAMNQIGNLSVKLNGGIDTTYYMLHSMLSTIAYEGAALNLQHHLSNCLVQFATLPGTHESKPIEVFSNSFITQIHHFLYENVNITNFGKGITDLIVNFQERLATYDPDLDERFLFRISSICVLTFWQLQAQNSPNISLAVAFATAMFSQLLTQLGVILEQHKHFRKIESLPVSPVPALTESGQQKTAEIIVNGDTSEEKLSQLSFEIESLNIQVPNGKGNERSSDTEEKVKKKNNILALRRRRRVFKNMIPTTSSDESEEDLSEDDDGSYVDSNAKDESDDSEYGWSSDSENFSDSDEDEDNLHSAKKDVGTKRASDVNGDLKRGRAFGSSSSSQSRSDTSGNSALVGAKKVYDEPPVLEFASGKNSTQSNCSNGGGDVEIDGESNQCGNLAEKFVIPEEALRKCRSQLEPLMVAVLPFVRWLQVSPEIKDAFAANCGKEYVVAMCNMFNLLGSQNWGKKFDDIGEEIKEDWKVLQQQHQKDKSKLFRWQLPEDRSMLGLPRYEEFVKDLDTSLILNENELLVCRMARILLFGGWLVETKSFSMVYDEEKNEFSYESPRAERNRERERKMKKLMDLKPDTDALTKAYRASGNADGGRQGNRRGKGGGRGTERKRRGRNNRNDGGRNKDSASVVFIVVDLPAVLQQLKNVQKLANKRRFVVVLPRPVWKAIDEMKDRKDAESDQARVASHWLKSCAAEGHRGVRCLRDHEKIPIDYDYPKSMDEKTSDFFVMMETCQYLLAHDRDEKAASRTFFGDMRDKFRVICLSGHKDLLTPNSTNVNPIAIARVVGTFVDLVAAYPPNHHGRRKWKGSKSNG